ncbi:MAG: PDDEXK nuclease domain-containing protein [Bacteroidales bacterium]|nr:PDDEXK nuclease domain-containing protein [Bacteroidales bacterium]
MPESLISNNNLYTAISSVLQQARQTAYRAANFTMVTAYWEIGRLITEDELKWERAEYGKQVLKNLAERLTNEFGKGFDESNLRYMRLFFKAFPICDTLRHELTWSHFSPLEFIRDPYVLDFLNLKDYPSLHESDIEKSLISHLQDFLLELGKGFCFVARQKRMRYEEDDFYVDLVFYNSILKCYVLIDLKLGKLTHGDVGQMDSYIRMFDELTRQPDDNPTIGLILCSEKNEAIVKYSILNEAKQIFASKYKLTLPSEEELKLELEKERKKLEK